MRTVANIVLVIVITMQSACVINRSAALRWNGWVEPDIEVLSALDAEHTLTISIMPQYESSYEGPVFATGGGEYYVGMAGFGALGAEGVVVRVRGVSKVYSIPDPVRWRSYAEVLASGSLEELPAAKWRHLAVTVDGASVVSVYLDAVKLELNVGGTFSAGLETSTGKIMMGRKQQLGSERRSQYYGFIDNLGVFDRVLDDTEISALVGARLTGREPDLVAGLNFDRYFLRKAPPKVDHSIKYEGSAYRVSTVGAKDPAADSKRLPAPLTTAELNLPFTVGEVWQVIQGMNNYNGSHRGFAAFTLDLIYVPPVAPRGVPYQQQITTFNRPIRAAAPGQVTHAGVEDTNLVAIRHDGGEFSAYLHLSPGSIAVSPGQFVAVGDVVGNAGSTGVGNPAAFHLHFGVNDGGASSEPTLVTYPFAFTEYQVSDDFGLTWRPEESGRLFAGQWVQRTQ